MSKQTIKEFYNKYSTWITIMLWIVICLWRIPFINKGIDYTDTGFNMENYKNVFYGNGISDIGLVFTNLLGGIIYKALPAYQLLVYRILHWIIGILSAFFAYQIFKRYLDKNLILVLLLGISLATKGGESIYSYYPMTSLLLMLVLMFLHIGLVDKKNNRIVLAGVISGINIFFRLTNIMYLAMVLLILFYGYIKGYSKKETIKLAFMYIAGVVGVCICIIPILFIILGKEDLINSSVAYVRELFGIVDSSIVNPIGIEEKSGHSLIAEIKTMGQQGISSILTIVCFFIPVTAIWSLLNFLINRIDKIKNKTIFKYILLSAYSIVFSFIFKDRISGTIILILSIGSVCFSFILLLKYKKLKPEYILLFATTFLMGCCSVLGSDLGFKRISILQSYAILSVALGLILIINSANSVNKYIKIVIELSKSFSIIFVICLYIVGVFCMIPKSYLDADYGELNYSVNPEIKVLKGMNTSKTRADQLNEYYEIMQRKELQDAEVAMFGFFPLGFNISEQKDYFESVMPCVDYPRVSVERLLSVIQEKQEQGIKPVIVISYVNQLQRGDDHFTSDAKMAVLNYMLELNDYDTYLDDEYFTIYIPSEV